MSAPDSPLALVRATAGSLAETYASILATGRLRPTGSARGFLLWTHGEGYGFVGAVQVTGEDITLHDAPDGTAEHPPLRLTWRQVADVLAAQVRTVDRAAIVAAHEELVRLQAASDNAAVALFALAHDGTPDQVMRARCAAGAAAKVLALYRRHVVRPLVVDAVTPGADATAAA